MARTFHLLTGPQNQQLNHTRYKTYFWLSYIWQYPTYLMKLHLTSSCQMFQTQVGFQQQWQFPSPRPWEQPWWVEAVCSAYSSSNRQKHFIINERDTNSSAFSVQVKSLLFYNQILTEWTKAFRRYLQRRVKAMGLEKSFTSGVPYTRKSRRRRIFSWAGCYLKKQPHIHTHTPAGNTDNSYLHEVAVEEGSLWQDEVGTDAAGYCLLDSYQLLLSQVNAGM